jgi:hypothetical protein
MARLTGSDTENTDQFGYAVAIDGTLLAVGAPQADAVGNNSGLGYVFALDGTGWRQVVRRTPAGLTPGSRFGWSVAVQGATVVVGAPDSEGAEDIEASGTVEVFRFDGTHGTHVARVHASDATASDHFGASVAISNGTVLVGTPGDDDAAGSAYVLTFEAIADVPAAFVASIHYATSGGRLSTRHLHVTVVMSDVHGQPMNGASATVRIDRDAAPYWTGSGITSAEGTLTFSLRNYPFGCYRTTVIDLNGDTPETLENEHCKESFRRRP